MLGEERHRFPSSSVVEHSKLYWEVPGSFPSWGVLIIFPQAWDCQRHLLSLRYQIKFKQSRWTFIHMFQDELSVLKVVSYLLMGRCTNAITIRTLDSDYAWRGKTLDFPVAQLVEHSKLYWEVLGSFPSWGVLILFLQASELSKTSIVTSLPNHIQAV